MDPFSQLKQLQISLEVMTKSVKDLENHVLDVLTENTELKVENQLLREKIDRLSKKDTPPVKSQAGFEVMKNTYNSGYHICNTYYGSHRKSGEDCIFCLNLLDNFGKQVDRSHHADPK